MHSSNPNMHSSGSLFEFRKKEDKHNFKLNPKRGTLRNSMHYKMKEMKEREESNEIG